jgi:catechol 2,3-dioxygenase-like lactoylglutathione lyase family enzyme
MVDHATPNLPARDFQAASDFYGRLGFAERYRDSGWMILEQGNLKLEFFPFPDLDPSESSFGCCLRLDDVQRFYETCRAAGLPETHTEIPRIVPPRVEHWGGTVGYLVDPDGTLLRLVQN